MKTVQDLVDNLNLNYDLVCRVERTDIWVRLLT